MLVLAPLGFFDTSLPARQQGVAVILGAMTFIGIIYLVRQRKLREEFAWIWLLTGAAILVLSLWYQLLLAITVVIGAVLPTSALFFCGLLFLVGICLHFSIRVSSLTNQVKNLSQEHALLRYEMEKSADKKAS